MTMPARHLGQLRGASGFVHTQVGIARKNPLQSDPSFHQSELAPQTKVRAKAKTQVMVRRPLHIESAGIFELAWVVIGGPQNRHTGRTPRDFNAVQSHVFGRIQKLCPVNGAPVPNNFFYR